MKAFVIAPRSRAFPMAGLPKFFSTAGSLAAAPPLSRMTWQSPRRWRCNSVAPPTRCARRFCASPMAPPPGRLAASSILPRRAANEQHHRNRHRIERRAGVLSTKLASCSKSPTCRSCATGRQIARTSTRRCLAKSSTDGRRQRLSWNLCPRAPEKALQARLAFGRSKGVIEGVCAAAGVPVAFITPSSWKRAIGIPPGKDGAKDAARSEAIRRWPGQAGLFARVKDDGRAEAALIAVAGLLRKGGAL